VTWRSCGTSVPCSPLYSLSRVLCSLLSRSISGTKPGLLNTPDYVLSRPTRTPQVFSSKAGPQASQSLELREEAWRKEDLPLVEQDLVRDDVSKLDMHKSMDPDGMHPQVLMELADVIAEPLTIIFERSWRTEGVPESWTKASVTPVFKKSKTQGTTGRSASPASLER